LSRSDGAGDAAEERFALLEDEAVTFLLNTGSSHAGRLIFVPAPAGSFGSLDVIHAADDKALSHPGAPASPDPDALLPLFPNETARPSVTAGVKQVVSPLCPASASLIRMVSEPARLGAERIDECLNQLKTELFAGMETSGATSPSAD
jgi:hypothetical protein